MTKTTDPAPRNPKVKAALARRDALSPEQRAAIAKKAAAARWGEKPLLATHRGNFLDEFGIDVDCYVLNDEKKTAVISQRGMAAALGFDQSSGSRLPRFLEGEKIKPYVGRELASALSNPLVFQGLAPGPGGTGMPPMRVHGYDVTILIDVCNAILMARDDGRLERRQQHIARAAQVIVNASAKAGIQGLVYALAGYDATKAEVIAAFKFYVREEAREYEKEFPTQLYEEWYRLYELPKPERNRPWKFRTLTINHVYTPLARSDGKILKLLRDGKAAGSDKTKRLHQFLSEVGVKALRTHLGQLLGIAQVSATRSAYEHNVTRVFGVQMEMDFDQS